MGIKSFWAVAAVAGAASALVMGGCGSSSPSASSTSSSPPATGQTRTVQVDNKTDKFIAGFLAYFPNQVTVHPGDTVDFHENWTGEPHTVTMGTLVEAGLAAANAAGPNSTNPVPAYDSLPTLLPQGPGDVHQNAGQPCFLSSGAPPTDSATPCPKTAQPAFNGTQTYYSSGFLASNSTYQVKVAANTAPGTYHYYCSLHGPSMSGTITVAPAATTIPTQADVTAQGNTQLDSLVTGLLPGYQAAVAGQPHVPPGVAPNLAGLLDQSVQTAGIEQFLPANINAKVGQKVAWTILGPHTITFGATAPIPDIITIAPDGGVHENPLAGPPSPLPSGGPPAPTTGPPKAKTIDGGTYDGTGFHNSGVQASFPPGLVTYTLTFTKPGTFTYVCLIHPGMAGQVTVTN